ncbi:MBL fold metallo-hydrolase, partial [Patulibacter sp. S7RM1-6]
MRLTPRVHLVASATHGTVTSPWDCHVYLLDGGDELALVDAGAGLAPDALLANVAAAGHDPARVRHLLLTH